MIMLSDPIFDYLEFRSTRGVDIRTATKYSAVTMATAKTESTAAKAIATT